MPKNLKTHLRTSPSAPNEPSVVQDTERRTADAAETAKPSAPLYELVADGNSIWRNICDAAYAFCTSEDLGLGSRVKDQATGEIRNITEEEKKRFYAEVQSLSDRR